MKDTPCDVWTFDEGMNIGEAEGRNRWRTREEMVTEIKLNTSTSLPRRRGIGSTLELVV